MKYLTNSLEKILIKHKDIEKNLMHQDKLDNATIVKLNKEYAELSPLIEKISDYRKCEKNINNLKDLQNDNDELIRDEAEKELKKENYQLKTLETDLFKLLIPKDVNDNKNSILEIRAGTGGDEASLFAANLFNMYQKYADVKNWKLDILSISF